MRAFIFASCYLFGSLTYASITTKSAEPSYQSLTGVCSVKTSNMQLSLLRGYLINPKGYVLGKLEKLDDFHFILHRQVEAELNGQAIHGSVPVALDSLPLDSKRMEFLYSVSAKPFFECDFSKPPAR
jgi:hypothetical protein